MKSIKAILNKFNYVCGVFVAIIIFAMVCITCLQIVARSAGHGLSWSEEITRYMFVWASFLAASCMYYKGGHVAVTLLREKLPRVLGKVLEVIAELVCLAVSEECIRYGIQYMIKSQGQTSPTMHLPMMYPYLAIVVGFGLIALYSVINLLDLLTSKKEVEE